jgi:hypothetical protein
MGHQDDGTLAPRAPGLCPAEKVVEEMLPHLAQIPPPLPQILMTHGLKDVFEPVKGHLKGPFGVPSFPADMVHSRLNQHLIAQEKEVGLEDPQMLLREVGGQTSAEPRELLSGLLESLPEALHLGLYLIGADAVAGDLRAPSVHEVDLTPGNPRRDPDPLEDLFFWGERRHSS